MLECVCVCCCLLRLDDDVGMFLILSPSCYLDWVSQWSKHFPVLLGSLTSYLLGSACFWHSVLRLWVHIPMPALLSNFNILFITSVCACEWICVWVRTPICACTCFGRMLCTHVRSENNFWGFVLWALRVKLRSPGSHHQVESPLSSETSCQPGLYFWLLCDLNLRPHACKARTFSCSASKPVLLFLKYTQYIWICCCCLFWARVLPCSSRCS